MQGDELLERCGQLASEQAALQRRVELACPLEAGEDIDSARLDDADHWVGVYSELADFKRELLREIDRQARDMDPEAAASVSRSRRAFELELQRVQLHLDYWRERRAQLQERPPGFST